jgi:hypothetical protein
MGRISIGYYTPWSANKNVPKAVFIKRDPDENRSFGTFSMG